MKPTSELPMATKHSKIPAATFELPLKETPGSESPLAPSRATTTTKSTPVQIVLMVLGTVAFLYFDRPLILPVFMACFAGMALKPLTR